MDRYTVFNKELDYMKNDRIKESSKILIDLLPDYFFTEAASSTGKYHPSFALGEGGLVRHTKAAVRIAYELLNNKCLANFTDDEKDLIILSLILHDGIKRGFTEEKYTRVDHPLLASQFVKDNIGKTKLTSDEMNYICESIESHMGEFNTDYKGNVILPLPKSKNSRFVNMCDYLSSKKFLDIKYDENDNIIN